MAVQVQDKEIGSVLIAINSYIHPRTPELEPLPYTDQAFKDYIEAFYCYLFFHVTTLVDFTLQEFEIGLEKFVQGSNGISRIAVVVLSHGSLIEGEEYAYTNDGNVLSIVRVQERLHELCPKKSKYLFFDTCRSDFFGNTPTVRSVLKACTLRTTVVHSTLPFSKAFCYGTYSYGLWSYLFTRKIREPMDLANVVNSVDDEIQQVFPDHFQASERLTLAPLANPNFRELAREENQGCIRELHPDHSKFIEGLESTMTSYRCILDTSATNTTLGEVRNRSDLTQPISVGQEKVEKDTVNATAYHEFSEPIKSTSDFHMANSSQTEHSPQHQSGMDAVINSDKDLLKYKDDMIAHLSLLGTVLEMSQRAGAIIENERNLDKQFTGIVNYWLELQNFRATWKVFCDKLEASSTFNRLRCKIENDHK